MGATLSFPTWEEYLTLNDGLVARIRAPLGAFRRALRRRVHALLHPRRRAAALGGIRARPVPGRILALCLGNVCRSPYVEAYLNTAAGELGFQVISRGFIGPGRPPPREALDAAGKRGIDTREHVSGLVEREDLDSSDLVILVDPAHGPRLRRKLGAHGVPVLVLGDLDPQTADFRTIQDPWGTDPEVFHRVFDRLDRCMDVLLTEWRSRRDG